MGRGRKKTRAKGGGAFKDFGDSIAGPGGAAATLDPQYQAWLDAQTAAQDKALKAYTGSGYKAWNEELRLGGVESLPSYFRQPVDALQASLEAAPPAQQNMMTYRGFGFQAMWEAADAGHIGAGDIIEERAFVSSSTSEQTAKHWGHGNSYPVVYRMRLPKGTKGGAYVRKKGVPGESEFLYKHGTKLRIDKITMSSNIYGGVGRQVAVIDVTVQ